MDYCYIVLCQHLRCAAICFTQYGILIVSSNLKQNAQAWRTLETFVAEGKIRHLGISNIYQPSLLRKMIDFATVPVDIVQNRWWEGNGWDWESELPRSCELAACLMTFLAILVLDICKEHGIRYQYVCVRQGIAELTSDSCPITGASGHYPEILHY